MWRLCPKPHAQLRVVITALPAASARGLRAIKSVLVVAGSLLRAEEGQVESQVLFRALRDFNIPKILAPVSLGAGGRPSACAQALAPLAAAVDEGSVRHPQATHDGAYLVAVLPPACYH